MTLILARGRKIYEQATHTLGGTPTGSLERTSNREDQPTTLGGTPTRSLERITNSEDQPMAETEEVEVTDLSESFQEDGEYIEIDDVDSDAGRLWED